MTLRRYVRAQRAAWRAGEIRGPVLWTIFAARVIAALAFFAIFGWLLVASWGRG